MVGSAGFVLVEGVRHLDPERAVFEAMLEGWEAQQRARFLKDATIVPRLRLVRRFAGFTGQYPWQWDSSEAEAFFVSLRSSANGRAPHQHRDPLGRAGQTRLDPLRRSPASTSTTRAAAEPPP